jgi:hypothetical protein
VYFQATNRVLTVVPCIRLFLDTLQGHSGGALIKRTPQREDFEEDEEEENDDDNDEWHMDGHKY